jgi:hypothetical protein
MKTIKSKIAQPAALFQSSDHEPVDDTEVRKYLKQIAYWVGQVLFEFNHLEHIITSVIGERINRADVRGYEYIFLTGLTYSQKIELLQRLYRYEINFVNPPDRQEKLREDVDEIVKDLKELGKVRNSIIHSDYYTLDKNGFVRKEIKFSESDAEEQWVNITRDLLVENLNHIIEASTRIEEFDEEVYI